MSVKEELARLHRQQQSKVHLLQERAATIQRVGDTGELTVARRAESTAIKQARIVDQLRTQVVEVLVKYQIEDTPDTVVDGLHQPVQRALDATATSGIRQAISLERVNDRFRPLPFPAKDPRLEDDVVKGLAEAKKVPPGVVTATISRAVYALDKEGKLIQTNPGAVRKSAQDCISSLPIPGSVRVTRISQEIVEAAIERTAILVRSTEIDLRSLHPAEARLIRDIRQHNLWGRLSAQDLISVGKRLTVPETIITPKKEKNPDSGKIKLGDFQLELLVALAEFNPQTGERIYKSPARIIEQLYEADLALLSSAQDRQDFIRRKTQIIYVTKSILVKKLGAAVASPDKMGRELQSFFDEVKSHPSRREWHGPQIVELVKDAFKRPREVKEKQPRVKRAKREESLRSRPERQPKIAKEKTPKLIDLSKNELLLLNLLTEFNSTTGARIYKTSAETACLLYTEELGKLATEEERNDFIKRATTRVSVAKVFLLRKLKAALATPDLRSEKLKAFFERVKGHPSRAMLSDEQIVDLVSGAFRRSGMETERRMTTTVRNEYPAMIRKKRPGPSQGNSVIRRKPATRHAHKPKLESPEPIREPVTSEKVLLYRPERNGSRDRADIPSEDEMVAFNLLMLSSNGLPAFRDIQSYLLVAHGAEFDQASPHRKFSLISEKERELYYATQRISEAIVRGRGMQRRGESLPQHLKGLIEWMSLQRVEGEPAYPDDLDSSKIRDFLNRRISIFELTE